MCVCSNEQVYTNDGGQITYKRTAAKMGERKNAKDMYKKKKKSHKNRNELWVY